MRGATGSSGWAGRGSCISIHAPRAGRDPDSQHFPTYKIDFNPRAPCGARRDTGIAGSKGHGFQSTRPVRGATNAVWRFLDWYGFQSTRPVRGATMSTYESRRGLANFNPRAPCGARHIITTAAKRDRKISIHAPRAGRDDQARSRIRRSVCHFNPRAPCGARQQKYTKLLYTLLRQKAILRQFHAKRRLLKRFSTYKYRNTFLICSANRMGKICTLPLRTTRSLDLPEGMSACSQSARFCFRTFFPSSKTADYPALDP